MKKLIEMYLLGWLVNIAMFMVDQPELLKAVVVGVRG